MIFVHTSNPAGVTIYAASTCAPVAPKKRLFLNLGLKQVLKI